MSTPTFPSEIIATLNTLLTNLHIPIPLQSPQDLTPSLLIAILESTLEYRLPIPAQTRQSQSLPEKIHATKIFLGVLEHDVLQMDVGLSDVDPRKLALGEWDEVVFVGELLCWLGKKRGILPPETVETLREIEDSSALPKMQRQRAPSPSTRSTATDSANTDLSMQSTQFNNSDTTIMTDSSSSIGSPLPYRMADSPTIVTAPHRPRCIHELDEPGVVLFADADVHNRSHFDLSSSLTVDSDVSYCACSTCHSTSQSTSQQASTSVRYTGWIDTVDDSLELESFEASRKVRSRHQYPSSASGSRQRSRKTNRSPASSTSPRTPPPPVATNRIVTKHTSPSEHTLALLNERARLLAELARLRDPSV
jgi:hypothetical protein